MLIIPYQINVGSTTNFFEKGLQSLSVYLIVAHLKKYNLEVSALDILKYPVVCDLAKHVKPMVTLNNVIERKKDKYINLSPQQMNLWHFQKLYPYDSSYNTVIVYSITGPLNVNKLISSMQVIIDKHDALRTKIKIIDGEPMQYFDPMFLRI